jgi:hypothetical protein
MKMTSVFLIGVLLLVGGCASPQHRVQRAVARAFAPENPPSVWIEPVRGLSNASSDPEIVKSKAAEAMGKHNFTCWLLLTKRPTELDSGDYEWTLSPAAGIGAALANYLSDHHTFVRKQDISDLQWAEDADGTVSGTLQVATSYGLAASFVFHASSNANGLTVDHLAIQKKGSTKISDGITVFQK